MNLNTLPIAPNALPTHLKKPPTLPTIFPMPDCFPHVANLKRGPNIFIKKVPIFGMLPISLAIVGENSNLKRPPNKNFNPLPILPNNHGIRVALNILYIIINGLTIKASATPTPAAMMASGTPIRIPNKSISQDFLLILNNPLFLRASRFDILSSSLAVLFCSFIILARFLSLTFIPLDIAAPLIKSVCSPTSSAVSSAAINDLASSVRPAPKNFNKDLPESVVAPTTSVKAFFTLSISGVIISEISVPTLLPSLSNCCLSPLANSFIFLLISRKSSAIFLQ